MPLPIILFGSATSATSIREELLSETSLSGYAWLHVHCGHPSSDHENLAWASATTSRWSVSFLSFTRKSVASCELWVTSYEQEFRARVESKSHEQG